MAESTTDIETVIDHLRTLPHREAVATELSVLQSIYGHDAVRLWYPPDCGDRETSFNPLRYEVSLTLPSPHDDIQVIVLVSIPCTYPTSSPPQLQLLSQYVGAFSADSMLFGSILRTFISVNGVEWIPDTVCVFDGLQKVIEHCTGWYEDHLYKEKSALEQEMEQGAVTLTKLDENTTEAVPSNTPSSVLKGVKIFEAGQITDRKSVFIGRACKISHPDHVPLVLNHLRSDRRIAKAAHPTIHAWRCRVNNVLHQDNDDDGESAAGGRLAHLLQILEVENVLVIVTRYFGGIPLGPDRFKHINHAARSALDSGGFLEAAETRKQVGRGKGRR